LTGTEQLKVQWQLARCGELLRELRRQTTRGSRPDLREILDWLHRQIDADAALVASSSMVEAATTGFPREVLHPLESLLGRLSGGQMATATTQVGAMQVRLEAFGLDHPRPVLVVTGPSALTREEAAVTSHTGDVIAVLLQARRTEEVLRGYQDKARQLRFAVLSALLEGDPDLARRMTTGAVPELLEASRLRVQILHCSPADRDRIAQTYQDPSGYHDLGLMVNCPVYRQHLVCLFPEDVADDVPGQGELLRHLVRDNAHYALGISGPHPLHATAQAYDEALHALAVARNSPRRVAVYGGEAPLEQVLSGPAARAWASDFLRPMSTAAQRTLTIARLAMARPRTRVARTLGISRNTVTTHLKHVETLLGLNLDDVRSRAALDLALAIAGPHPVTVTDHGTHVPALEQLLHTPPATAWAEAFLHPLRDTRHDTLRRTLRAWIDADLDAQRTARHLGMSRNTVRAHLRRAEHLLNRDLLTTGTGVHDLVHALDITETEAHHHQPFDSRDEDRATTSPSL
jgi:DNA-binding CsgD family transcriptional regulator